MLRRSFLIGIGSLFAAPAIVRAQSIMPVNAIRYDRIWVCAVAGVSSEKNPTWFHTLGDMVMEEPGFGSAHWAEFTTVSLRDATCHAKPGATIMLADGHAEPVQEPLRFPYGDKPTRIIGVGTNSLVVPEGTLVLGVGGSSHWQNVTFSLPACDAYGRSQ